MQHEHFTGSVAIAPPPMEALPTHVDAPDRENVLHELLPYDYDYAKESGLIDMFDYDPATGDDGLLHTLAGNTETGPNGAVLPHGFHHEESGRVVWGMVRDQAGNERPVTRVERGHLETANNATRRRYAERLAEPYMGHVAIGDRKKMAVRRNPDTGEVSFEATPSAMYPKEYDALAVMQAVRQAYENRDRAFDRETVDHRGDRILINEGQAVLIDDKSTMTIRLVINPKNMKIKSAFPSGLKRSGIMNLTEEQFREHMTYGMSRQR
jgi:hypothetical protein